MKGGHDGRIQFFFYRRKIDLIKSMEPFTNLDHRMMMCDPAARKTMPQTKTLFFQCRKSQAGLGEGLFWSLFCRNNL